MNVSINNNTQAYPVMLGTMNNSGDLQAQFIHSFGRKIKVKAVAQVGVYMYR